jgi:hypothetical protein
MDRRRALERGAWLRRRRGPAAASGRPGPTGALSAGNAAVARALQREPDPSEPRGSSDPVTSLSMRGGKASDPAEGALSALTADYEAAMRGVFAWFDAAAEEVRKGGGFVHSVAELVDAAGSLVFRRQDGTTAAVREVIKPNELELGIRTRAKTLGLALLEHRAGSDVAGVQSEVMAILRNLGRIPTEVSFGGSGGRFTASIAGKVSGEAKLGDEARLGGEATASGVAGSVTVPGGKFGVGVERKEIKAEIRAGDLVTVKGSAGCEANGSGTWKAEISFGTLGGVVGAERVAKVMRGAQETFESSALELVRGIDDPGKIKEHGGPLAEAVGEAIETAKKSAAQARSGWSASLRGESSPAGGLSAAVILTWVF